MSWPATERLQQGLSQRSLARKAGVSFRTIQLLEWGEHDARRSTLAKISRALGQAPEPAGPRSAFPSLAATSARIERDGEASWRGPFFEFVDDFRARPDAAVAARMPEPGLSHRLQALFASTVDFLCAERGVPSPWWCAGVPPLPEPWFVSETENLKATAIVESPTPFRQRNIFVLGNFLSRA